MLQKTFSIYSEDVQDCRLFIETGRQHLALWCSSVESNVVKAFELFGFTQEDGENFENLLYQVKQHSILFTLKATSVNLITEEEQVVCIPTIFFSNNSPENYLSLAHGPAEYTYISTEVLNDITIVSGLPMQKMLAYKKYFPLNQVKQKYALLLKKYLKQPDNPGSRIYIIFYSDHFIITALKNDTLLLMQSREYQTAEDVLYIIMNTCTQNNLGLNETKISACGLIDENSGLYTSLSMYIENFEIEMVDGKIFDATGFNEYPTHYFASFFNYAI